MAMVNTSLFSSSNFNLLTFTNPSKHLNSFHHPFLIFSSPHHNRQKDFPLQALASSSIFPQNADYLEREFNGHGVSFTEIGESCVVKMGLDNGSVASLMLPSGLITSYKAHMWYGSTLEVLHTTVTEGEEEEGGTVVQGGLSMGFKCGIEGGVSWSPSTWVLHDVRGSPQNLIQVELMSTDSEDNVEIKHIVTLQQDLLNSEVVISNSKSSSLQLMGSFISHLAVSTPDAAYAVGLESSNYFTKPPFASDFSIIPPESKETGTGQSWGQTALWGLLPSWGRRDQKDSDESKSKVSGAEEMECEEKDNYLQLTEKLSRIYTSAPRTFTFIDRGRRNSVVVGRDGFDELYIFSPGSKHELYGNYAYICTGPSAMLKPIILGPKDVWRGGQYLHNPNL